MYFILVFLNVHFTITVVYGAQIFAFAPIYGQSHWNVMDAVLQTLVSAGHNVTAITPFIKKEKIENYTEVPMEFVSGKAIREYNLLPTVTDRLCLFHIIAQSYSNQWFLK